MLGLSVMDLKATITPQLLGPEHGVLSPVYTAVPPPVNRSPQTLLPLLHRLLSQTFPVGRPGPVDEAEFRGAHDRAKEDYQWKQV